MQTKLTLRIDDRIIKRAKAHAKRSGLSLSQLVSDLLALLQAAPEDATSRATTLSPAVRSLAGALAGQDIDESDYRRHLTRKHR